jgi:hypothetical protein
MPAEKFYLRGQIEGDGQDPDLTITWGTDHDGGSSTLIKDGDGRLLPLATPEDTAGLSRLIRALTRARTHMVQNRETQPAIQVPDWLKVDHTKPKPRPVEVIDNGPDQMPTHWAMAIPGTVLGEDRLVEWLAAAPPSTVVEDTNGRQWKRSQHTNPSHQWVGIKHRGLSTHEHLAKRGPLTYVGTLGMQR